MWLTLCLAPILADIVVPVANASGSNTTQANSVKKSVEDINPCLLWGVIRVSFAQKYLCLALEGISYPCQVPPTLHLVVSEVPCNCQASTRIVMPCNEYSLRVWLLSCPENECPAGSGSWNVLTALFSLHHEAPIPPLFWAPNVGLREVSNKNANCVAVTDIILLAFVYLL